MRDTAVALIALLMAAGLVGCIVLWGVFVERQIRRQRRALDPDDPADNLPWTFPMHLRRRWSEFDAAQKRAWIRRHNRLEGFFLFSMIGAVVAVAAGYGPIGLALMGVCAALIVYETFA